MTTTAKAPSSDHLQRIIATCEKHSSEMRRWLPRPWRRITSAQVTTIIAIRALEKIQHVAAGLDASSILIADLAKESLDEIAAEWEESSLLRQDAHEH